ncbi:MAG: head GIN domain-containing protein [Pseudomonadota bacterium]
MRTLLSLACLLALGGCAIIVAPNDGDVQVRSVFGSTGVHGDGHLTTERRTVGNLPGLDVSGPLHVDVRVGSEPSMQVEADANLLPFIRSEVNGNTLRIWVEGNIHSNNPMRVSYTVPVLSQLRSGGSGRMVVSGLNGASLNFNKSGSGESQLAGRVANLEVQVSGSGAVNASALQSGNANINITGSGRMTLGQVQAEAVTVNVHGSGDLQASGSVQTLDAHVHGSGGANLVGLASQRAELTTSGSGGISAMVKQSVVAQSGGSGRITVYGNPPQANVSGKHVQVVN